ncbi:hypothetical protein EDC30_10774 [Paucimonas lemoignei]|uniref:Short-chain dehydrogenase n=1 Tax=Paucimonas lemoignei TaxID=29443 RepID=A0A4R3HSY9_PAULE|nr:SDR family oxidoreductase [Paucimonas lemoignei]TCS36257.1 hypothetical protein EDC30_10774 [Paucimonas lemoignei]
MKAILTGHTRGLGAAIAGELLKRDIPVLGMARRDNADLASRHAGLLQQVQVDLANPEALSQWLASSALQDFIAKSRTVALINNAGTVQPIGAIADQDPHGIMQAVNLNVTAPLMLASALAATSREAGSERELRILHISSGAGRSAYAGWSVYCATKAALDQHARAVALDKLPGVRICSLAPGVIDTDMQSEIRATSLERFPMRERFDELKRNAQLLDPAECAKRLVEYLVSAHFGQTPVADLRELSG